MSLLIMSIGVISVFSLYPIAVLRSIQATQLTQSKILSSNAYSEMLGDPAMLNGAPPWRPNTFYRLGDVVTAPVPVGATTTDDPTRYICTTFGTSGLVAPDFSSVGTDPARVANGQLVETSAAALSSGNATFEDKNSNGSVNAGEPVWQRAYINSSNIVTTTGVANYASTRSLESSVNVIDPYGWATHHRDGATLIRDSYGAAPRFSGGLQMLVDNNATAQDTSRSLACLGGSPSVTVEEAFLPLFGASLDASGSLTPVRSYFNSVNPSNTATSDDLLSPSQLVRVAQEKVRLDGSYENTVGAIAGAALSVSTTSVGRTLITLPASAELAEFLTGLETTVAALEAADSPQFARVIVRSNTLGASASRWLVSGFDDNADGTVDVDGIAPAAFTVEVGGVSPAGLFAATDVTVEFEVFEPRFTWFATVARDETTQKVTNARCVVLFRRAFDGIVEAGYHARFGNDPTDTSDNGTTLNAKYAWIFPTRGIDLDDDGNATGAGETTVVAEIAVGRHIFDSSTGEWYQIQGIVDPGSATTPAQVELDREVPRPPSGPDPTLGEVIQTRFVPSTVQAMLPRGVVKVFPLNLER